MPYSPNGVPPIMPTSVTPSSWISLGWQTTQSGFTATASVTLGASNIFLYPFVVTEPYRVRRIWWLNGTTANGNTDAGVYSESGALLVSSGSTAQSGTSTIQSVSVDYTLSPGSYWMGLATSSATATFAGYTVGNIGNQERRFGYSYAQHFTVGAAVPLATQITLSSNLSISAPMMGISSLTTL